MPMAGVQCTKPRGKGGNYDANMQPYYTQQNEQLGCGVFPFVSALRIIGLMVTFI